MIGRLLVAKLLSEPMWIYFIRIILINIQQFSFKQVILNMSYAK